MTARRAEAGQTAAGPTARIAGVVLAGGLGRRIGGNKPTRLLVGRSLLDHVVGRLRPQVNELWLSVREVADCLPVSGLSTVADNGVSAGPLSGIAAAMAAAKAAGYAYLAACPCDVPFLPRDLVVGLRSILIEQESPGIVLSVAGIPQPTIGLWSVELLPRLAAALDQGVLTMRLVWRSCGVTAVAAEQLGWAPEAFINVNTPAELAAANALAFAVETPSILNKDAAPAPLSSSP